MVTRTVGDVLEHRAAKNSFGYHYVVHTYKFFGIPFYKRDEILQLIPGM